MSDPGDAIERSDGISGMPITRAQLRALATPRPGRALAATSTLLLVWVALGALAHTTAHLGVRVLCWLALGWVLNGLVQLGHDAWHFNLLARPWHNALFGHVLGVLFGVSFVSARHAHLRHHWYNRTARDPDAYNAGAGLGVQVQYYLVVVAGLVLAPLHFNVLYPAVYFRQRQEWAPHLVAVTAYALVWAGVVAWCSATGNLSALRDVWAVPMLCASPINGLKSVADHYANVWQGDRFHTATTVRTTPWLSALFNGLNYHLDHHLFPRVPGANLGALHACIAPALEARAAPVFDGYLPVWWRCLRDGPTYVTDGHRFLKRPP
jgi:fatty acid desaturase